MAFVKATKKKAKLRLAIDGASGSGKTYSSLLLAKGFGGKTAVIDTEHGSASLYSDKFDFDVLELRPPYTPERYIEAIKEAEKAGYDVLVIDSISHEWNGKGGCLDLVNSIGGNSYTAWGKVTPRHDEFINTILASPLHIIATMRSKANYETGKDEKTGKMTIQKQGTAPIQRDGVDFEFTIVFDLNQNHNATATKDRSGIFDGKDEVITEATTKKLLEWLNSGGELKEETKTDPNKNNHVFSLVERVQAHLPSIQTDMEAQKKYFAEIKEEYSKLPADQQKAINKEFNHFKKIAESNIPGAASKEDILIGLINNLKKDTSPLKLTPIDQIIDGFHKEKAHKYAVIYNAKLKELGIDYQYEELSF